MKYNKYNKRYGGWTLENNRIVISSADDDEPIVDESVKRKSKLVTPRSKNTETLIAHPPSPHEADIRIKHEPDLQWGAKSLSQKGTIRFTSYEEK